MTFTNVVSLIATVMLIILTSIISYQGRVIHGQRELIQQMTTNPSCMGTSYAKSER